MAWGDRIDQFAIKEGQELRVSIDLESREYNGRWYTDVKAWKVAQADQGDAPPPDMEAPPPAGIDEDLPF